MHLEDPKGMLLGFAPAIAFCEGDVPTCRSLSPQSFFPVAAPRAPP